jgi:hypothetical protein
VSKLLRSPLLVTLCLLPLGWAYAAGSSQGTLDLRVPDLRNSPLLEQLGATADSQETDAISVIDTSARAEDTSDVHVSRTGIGSVYWAARHPAEAWRVVAPVNPDSGSLLFEDGRVKCSTFTAPAGRHPTCP